MTTGAVAGGVAVFLLVLVVSLAVRRPVQRRIFAGTGLSVWLETAAGLSWRDRWSLGVATTFGRATSPRLAPFAVERGEATAAALERSVAKGGRIRWLAWTVGGFGILLLVLNTVLFAVDDEGASRIGLVTSLYMAGWGFGFGPLQRAQARLARRSVARTQEQLDA